MGQVLSIVYRAIATHLVKQAGLSHKVARTGAVTLIQRFGSALNLNIHFHMLFLEGVYFVGLKEKVETKEPKPLPESRASLAGLFG